MENKLFKKTCKILKCINGYSRKECIEILEGAKRRVEYSKNKQIFIYEIPQVL